MAGAPEKEQSDMTDNWANIMSEVADLERGIKDEEVHQDLVKEYFGVAQPIFNRKLWLMLLAKKHQAFVKYVFKVCKVLQKETANEMSQKSL